MVQSLINLMKRYPAFVGSFWGTSLMGVTYLVFSGLPKYFSGDDYLLLISSRSPDGYASSFFSCVNDVGMGKWRPAFVCTVAPILKLFGDQYWYFFLLNLGLIFLICIVAAGVLKSITNLSYLGIAIFAFVLPFSRFAWYGRISPFGLMEFGALLFTLLFVRQFLLALRHQTKSSWYLAVGIACTASLFHERYLVLVAAGFFIAVINLRNRRMPIPVAPWVLCLGSYVAIKLFLLQLDPIIGGGEVPIRSSADTWILEHFLIGVKAIAGIGNGTNIGFDATGYLRQPTLGVVGKIWLAVVAIVLLLIVSWKTRFVRRILAAKHDIDINLVEQQTVIRQLLLTSGLLLIVPASTVISRIEGRWLFGPEVLLLILLVGVLKSHSWRFVILSTYLIFSLSCLQFLPDYEQPIKLSNNVFEYVDEKLDGRTELVYTIVDPRARPGMIDWLDWVLGRGNKFEQIGVKSAVLVSNSQCTGSCIRLVFEDTERFNFVSS